MEIDVKQRRRNQRNRRRERAQRMQAERDKDVAIGGAGAGADPDSAEEDAAPHVREKPPRPPLRRKKPKEPSPVLEEDIIDGFSILGFKSYEDLEVRYKLIICLQSIILVYRHYKYYSRESDPAHIA